MGKSSHYGPVFNMARNKAGVELHSFDSEQYLSELRNMSQRSADGILALQS